VVPLRPIEAHLGERRYSSYSLLTSALEGGEWSASRPGRALPPRKEPPVPIVQEAGRAPEPVWTQRLEEKSSASVGDRTPAVQSVVKTLYWLGYPAPSLYIYIYICIYIYIIIIIKSVINTVILVSMDAFCNVDPRFNRTYTDEVQKLTVAQLSKKFPTF
jgi:hypothetical protein